MYTKEQIIEAFKFVSNDNEIGEYAYLEDLIMELEERFK